MLDPVRIKLVILNLVDNAIKYSPKGGEVSIFGRAVKGSLVVGVRDRGIGISPEHQQQLFQSFERVQTWETRAIPGLGLGLRVCRILVEAHGGRLWLESEAGKGSTFYFSLPA